MVGEAVDRLYRTGNASDAELKLLIGLEDPPLALPPSPASPPYPGGWNGTAGKFS